MRNDKLKPCSNCKETVEECACMRNICIECGKPVGNITFTVCDDCWDKESKMQRQELIEAIEGIIYDYHIKACEPSFKEMDKLLKDNPPKTATELMMKAPENIKSRIGCIAHDLAIKIVDSIGDDEEIDIEPICEKVHQAYCANYLKRKGKPYWSYGRYKLLDEETKDIDRATVRAVLKALSKQDIIKVKELK